MAWGYYFDRRGGRLFFLWERAERDGKMTENLNELLEATKKVKPSTEENEQQRRSFAFGNTNIENPSITRETVDKEAEELRRS
jgi:hypothetical protein